MLYALERKYIEAFVYDNIPENRKDIFFFSQFLIPFRFLFEHPLKINNVCVSVLCSIQTNDFRKIEKNCKYSINSKKKIFCKRKNCRFFDYNERCIFCLVTDNEIDFTKRKNWNKKRTENNVIIFKTSNAHSDAFEYKRNNEFRLEIKRKEISMN